MTLLRFLAVSQWAAAAAAACYNHRWLAASELRGTASCNAQPACLQEQARPRVPEYSHNRLHLGIMLSIWSEAMIIVGLLSL